MMTSSQVSGERPHPLDVNYESLKAGLSHVKEEEEEYDVIEKYLTATKPSWRKAQLLDVFRVDREGEVSVCVCVCVCDVVSHSVCLCVFRVRGSVITVAWRTDDCCGMGRMWLWWLPSSSQG